MRAASPEHPLMRELMSKAPGTYAHSVAAANLAEAGAEEIGADALVARVGAYFHDVGKIRRPAYFFENQTSGENPHDEAKPSLSALIITAHVRDGMALGKEYRLPEKIQAIIRQHHGTALVSYFYHKAAATDAAVYEADFRYQGEKPQSREAALVMLADSSEAAVRALKTPIGAAGRGGRAGNHRRQDRRRAARRGRPAGRRHRPHRRDVLADAREHVPRPLRVSRSARTPEGGPSVLISITSHREPEPLDVTAFERLAAFVLEREEAPASSRALHRARRPRRDDRAQRAVSRQGRPDRRAVVRVRRPVRRHRPRRARHARRRGHRARGRRGAGRRVRSHGRGGAQPAARARRACTCSATTTRTTATPR